MKMYNPIFSHPDKVITVRGGGGGKQSYSILDTPPTHIILGMCEIEWTQVKGPVPENFLVAEAI